MTTRVLILDDSSLMRQVMTNQLAREPDLEIIGACKLDQDALRLVGSDAPDVIVLDVLTTDSRGIDFMQEMMASYPTPTVLSTIPTGPGMQLVMSALKMGAVDFVPKAATTDILNLKKMCMEIVKKVRIAKEARLRAPFNVVRSLENIHSDKILLIAGGIGGPKSLNTLFESLPARLGISALVVQQMPIGAVSSFATVMSRAGSFECLEAHEGHVLAPGKALFSPHGSQMRIGPNNTILLEKGVKVNDLCPSADVMFTSAAEMFGSRCVAVVLSGAGQDGAEGAAAIAAAGGQVIVEAKETAMIAAMPNATMQACNALPVSIGQMGEEVLRFLRKPVEMAA